MALTPARIMKYLGLMAAFAGIGTRVFAWLQQSQAETSPGGDDFTAEELAKLAPIIEESINTGLMSAEIPVVVSVSIFPLE